MKNSHKLFLVALSLLTVDMAYAGKNHKGRKGNQAKTTQPEDPLAAAERATSQALRAALMADNGVLGQGINQHAKDAREKPGPLVKYCEGRSDCKAQKQLYRASGTPTFVHTV